MSLPDRTTLRSYAGAATPAYLTSTLSGVTTSGQTFTINSSSDWYEITSSGTLSSNPLGTSGPFTLVVDYGTASEEKILCSGVISPSTGSTVITVWSDGVNYGRNYDGTAIKNHQPGSSSSYNVFPVAAAVEQYQFNRAVATAILSGTSAGGDLTGTLPSPSLVTTGVLSGTYGSSTTVAQFNVDAKGRILSASGVAISGVGTPGITQLTGDVTAGPGSGSQSASLIGTSSVSGVVNTIINANSTVTGTVANLAALSGVVTTATGNIATLSSTKFPYSGGTVSGFMTVSSGLTVSGVFTASSEVDTGNLSVGGNLTVTGTATISGNVVASGTVSVVNPSSSVTPSNQGPLSTGPVLGYNDINKGKIQNA